VALDYSYLRSSLDEQELFEDKSWQLSPDAWPLTSGEVDELSAIGTACLEFHQALETLYLRSVSGKKLLRNKDLTAPWVADYLDRGKPSRLVEHARSKPQRGNFPVVLRPDLLLTDDGYALTELDSVPGGIGLTAYLNRLYESGKDEMIVGAEDEMISRFYESLSQVRPDITNASIAIVVSEEASTYRPEMEWLAEQLQYRGHRVYCVGPAELFPLSSSICIDREGNPEKIDIIYRFFELFDLDNIKGINFLFEAIESNDVVVTPPLRPFQEEKMALALYRHHLLGDFWKENVSKKSRKHLDKLIPESWILDPVSLPPTAVIDGPVIGGKLMNSWNELEEASQKERNLILKISGFHETAWGARSVLLGSDSSKQEWKEGIENAISISEKNLHIVQEYRKPTRVKHRLFNSSGVLAEVEGRLRLCPYYFVKNGEVHFAGGLATFCPPDKKIIHGMQDAALVPCRVIAEK
jgi:hypothetical protein